MIEEFRKYLQQLGYSRSSCYMLPECVRSFLRHSDVQCGHRYIEEITRGDIYAFYKWLQVRPHKRSGRGLSGSYIQHHIYALKIFFKYLEETGEINHNPISVMKFKRPVHPVREPLSKEEIHQLFVSSYSLKETAILHLFYSCGLRRSEAEALNTKDVHFKSGFLYVRDGKGSRRRAIPITEKVSFDMEAYYLQERTDSTIKVSNTEAFILNQKGQRMCGNSYNKALKAIAARAGITGDTCADPGRSISLHHLRHSIATHLLENGLSLEYVRDFLGHSHLEATQIYVKVRQEQIKKL